VADLLLDLLALYFIAASGWTIYVAARFIEVAMIRPHMEALTASTYVKIGIAVGTVLGALLGLNGASVVAGGPRVIPQPVGLLLLAIAIGAPSISVIPMLRLLRRWAARGDVPPRAHARDSEPKVHYHRRASDLLDGPPPEPPADMP
jgi:hypothetical protein